MRGASSSIVLPLRVVCRRSFLRPQFNRLAPLHQGYGWQPPRARKRSRNLRERCNGFALLKVQDIDCESSRWPNSREDSDVRGIEVRERGEGEFDRHDLKDLRETLDDVLS